MIVGVGTDILDILRIEATIKRQGGAFLARVLSPEEVRMAITYPFRRQCEFVAGRFVAKEAIAKAVGCGLGNLVMSSVTILVTDAGLKVFAESPSALISYQENHAIHVSISHASGMATAFAVLERLP